MVDSNSSCQSKINKKIWQILCDMVYGNASLYNKYDEEAIHELRTLIYEDEDD